MSNSIDNAINSELTALDSLQFLRGIAAWLVVYHHYMQMLYSFESESWLGSFFSYSGEFGVDLFFVMSGFIMYYSLHHKNRGALSFIKKRLIRIVPLYWFVTFISILIFYLFPKAFTNTDWNAISLISSLFFIPNENPSGLGLFPLVTVGWTLNFEMFFYIWLALILTLFKQFWFAACSLSIFLLPILWASDWHYASIVGNTRIYEFAMGLCIGYIYLNFKRSHTISSTALGVILLSFGFLMYQTDLSKTPLLWRLDSITTYVSAAMFVAAALCFERNLSKTTSLGLFSHFGNISYSTYLLHPLVIGISIHYFAKPQTVFEEILLISWISLVVFTLSHLSYRFIEVGPVMRVVKSYVFKQQKLTDFCAVNNGNTKECAVIKMPKR